MVQYKAKINGKSGDEFISADIIIFDDNNQQIGMIMITDESEYEKIKAAVDNFSEEYVTKVELENILVNSDNDTEINATKILGKTGGEFTEYIKNEIKESNEFPPAKHDSTEIVYGLGSKTKYGHVKTVNSLTTNAYVDGEALSAYQGRILADKVKDNSKKGLTIRMGRQHIASNGKATYDGEQQGRLQVRKGEKLYCQLYCNDKSVSLNARGVVFILDDACYPLTTDAEGKAFLPLGWTKDRNITVHAYANGFGNFYSDFDVKFIEYKA